VAEDNTVHRTTVRIGDTIGNNVVILGGISEGQRIVTEGYQKLSEGNKVEY
jgi:multidrug efflux pump subunit AcrA (membrane-fusion protein)